MISSIIRYWRFWNQIAGFNWDPSRFNDFRAGFIVDDRLASCATVHVYIHQINAQWEIIMDDVNIMETGTLAPTSEPTASPTVVDVSMSSTNSPTDQPTSMPTVSSVTNCPPVGSPSKEVSAGPLMLAKSSTLCILTKALVMNGEPSQIAPVARSYDERAWEKSAGDFATNLLYGQHIGDYADGSQLTLPELGANEKYYLTSYSHTLSDIDTVARLLESATFGTTTSNLEAWNRGAATKDTASQWIEEQMNKPMTSHREFFRRRTNPRFPHPRNIGRSGHPCNGLSRWRRYAFSRKDGDQVRAKTAYSQVLT